jgi:hypothetical protein
MPLFSTWCDFKPAFAEDCLNKGLLENKKLLEQKVEETKTLMQMRDVPVRSDQNNFNQPTSPLQGPGGSGQVELQKFSSSQPL